MDFFRDLVGASLGQIGILGMALTQTVCTPAIVPYSLGGV